MHCSELKYVQKQLRERKRQIAELLLQYEKLLKMQKGDLIISQTAMKQRDYYKKQLKKKEKMILELQKKRLLLETDRSNTESSELYYADLKNENTSLNKQIDQLMKINFTCENRENRRIDHMKKEHEAEILRKEENLATMVKEKFDLEKRLQKEKTQKTKLYAKLQDREKKLMEVGGKLENVNDHNGRICEQLNLTVQDTEDLYLARELVLRTQGGCINELDFLGKVNKNVQERSNSLKLQNKELKSDIKNYEQLLQTQLKINKSIEDKKLNLVVKLKKLERENCNLRKTLKETENNQDEFNNQTFIDDATSTNDSPDHSVITLKLIKCTLDKDHFNVVDKVPMIFYTVDFYNFETVISPVIASYRPKHSFIIQYKIKVNET
eukprot:UN30432